MIICWSRFRYICCTPLFNYQYSLLMVLMYSKFDILLFRGCHSDRGLCIQAFVNDIGLMFMLNTKRWIYIVLYTFHSDITPFTVTCSHYSSSNHNLSIKRIKRTDQSIKSWTGKDISFCQFDVFLGSCVRVWNCVYLFVRESAGLSVFQCNGRSNKPAKWFASVKLWLTLSMSHQFDNNHIFFDLFA